SAYLPTATAHELGTGDWGLGPAAAAVYQNRPWTFGIILNHFWSIYERSDQPAVNATTAQLLVAVSFRDGWFLNTSPVTTSANWTARAARDIWLVPVGGGGGKTLRIGPQYVSVLAGAYWNVIRPADVPTPTWQLRLQVSLLFPR